MDGTAQFYFHDSLNDFLPYSKRAIWMNYRFSNSPAIKDAIEAIGVPHPEVEVILVNGVPVHFYYPLQPGDRVVVYPSDAGWQWPYGYSVKTGLAVLDRFVLDVHLGKLAKALRLLGFDTCYRNDYSDAAIVRMAQAENRIVLTRDIGLLKHRAVIWGYWLRSQQAEEQAAAVINYFKPAHLLFHPFSRCLACNGEIVPVGKEAILPYLPPKAALYFNEFYQCQQCQRVYWKGSHYDHMLQTIQKLQQSIKEKKGA